MYSQSSSHCTLRINWVAGRRVFGGHGGQHVMEPFELTEQNYFLYVRKCTMCVLKVTKVTKVTKVGESPVFVMCPNEVKCVEGYL